MILGIICLILVIILTILSISLRLIASGVSITKKVARAGFKGQPNAIDTMVNASVATLRFAAKIINTLRNFLLLVSGVGGLITGVIAILLIGSVSFYSIIMTNNLNNSVSEQISKDKNKTDSCSANWTEVPLCETVSTTKTFMSYTAVTSQDTDQWKMFNQDAYGEFKTDELGFGYIDDTDPDTGKTVKYYTVAVGSYYDGHKTGVKFRCTNEHGETFYIISSDQKADKDTHAGNKSAELQKSMSDSEKATNNPDRCLAGSEDMIEFVIESNEKGFAISTGNMNKKFDDEHPFEGAITKIERYDPNADPSACDNENGESTNSLNVSGPVIWVGDSRFVQLGAGVMGMNTTPNPNLSGAAMITGTEKEYNGNKEIVFAKGSGNLSTGFKVDESAITSKITEETTVVINYGVNNGPKPNNAESLATEYANYVNSLAKGPWKKAKKIVYMSVNPGDTAKAASNGMGIDNEGVKEFNSALKSKLDSSITWLNTYDTFINSPNWEDMASKCDGIHYGASPELNKIAYNAVRGTKANAGFVATATGHEADFTERYYDYDPNGVKGNPNGVVVKKKDTSKKEENKDIVKDTSTQEDIKKYKYEPSAYAAARCWDTNNHLGTFQLPSNWTIYAEKGEKILWDKKTKEELHAYYGYDMTDPVKNSILVYKRLNSNEFGYAFIEMVDLQQGRISISETTGEENENYGYKIKMYKSLSEFLKERNAGLVYMVKPFDDGHNIKTTDVN